MKPFFPLKTLVKILRDKQILLISFFIYELFSFMSLYLFSFMTFSQSIWSKWKCCSKCHTFFKVIPSNYFSYLVHLFQRAKISMKTWAMKSRTKMSHCSCFHRIQLAWGQEGNSSFWSRFFLASCIIFMFSSLLIVEFYTVFI